MRIDPRDVDDIYSVRREAEGGGRVVTACSSSVELVVVVVELER